MRPAPAGGIAPPTGMDAPACGPEPDVSGLGDRASAGRANGSSDTATTASALPSRQVRSTIGCPPAVTLTGRPTATGAARPAGYKCWSRPGGEIARA
jgi:hypothetical protein